MEWDFHAVTVTPWYLDKRQFSLKVLKVTRSKTGKLVWTVTGTLSTSTDKSVVVKDAFFISRNRRVPFIEGLNDGQRVSKSQVKILQDSHVDVNWKL